MTIVRSTPAGLDFVRAGRLRYRQRRSLRREPLGRRSRAARITRASVAAINTQAGAGDQMVSDEGAAANFLISSERKASSAGCL